MKTEEIKKEILGFLEDRGAKRAGATDRMTRILRGAVSVDSLTSDSTWDLIIAARDYTELRIHNVIVKQVNGRYDIEIWVSHHQPPLGVRT